MPNPANPAKAAPVRARTFKVLSALLSYPTAELQSATEELRDVLRNERLVTGRNLAGLEKLLDDIRDRDLYDLQERYTLLFDRTRSLSLHLFEHVHGESRDRGQAMVDLAEHYESYGFAVSARELPDYLPLFLEFLSVIPADDARQLLADPIDIISALALRLKKRRARYGVVFHALQAIARGKINKARLAELLAEPDPAADDLAALDDDWREAAVRFGPDADDGACGSSRIARRIRAGLRDAVARPPA